MQDLRLIIIEDELHNSRMLTDLVSRLRPYWHVEAVLESVEESVAWINSHPAPDLVLLDIQLSDGISFSIFEKVEVPDTTRIIFTTAYDKYAIRAFKVNSIDYLLKPIKEEELEQAFEKLERNLSQEESDVIPRDKDYIDGLIKSILSGKKEYRTRFLISGVKDYVKLETADVAYFYSRQKVTFAVDFKGHEHVLDYTLEQLENELDPQYFYRVNRQVIVSVDAVVKVSIAAGGKLKVKVHPELDFEVVVSRLKATDFKRWLGK